MSHTANVSVFQRGAYRVEHLPITRESEPLFFRYQLLTDPHSELSGFSSSCFDFGPKFLLQQSRHTGSLWRV